MSLTNLPTEMILEIMKYFHDPRDLLSLGLTCHHTFQLLNGHRQQMIDRYKSHILTRLVDNDLISTVLLAAYLRHLHKQKYPIPELEHRVQSSLDKYRQTYRAFSRRTLPSRLLVLSDIGYLLSDMKQTMDAFMAASWHHVEDYYLSSYWSWQPVDPQASPSHNPPSMTETRRFQLAILHFECYCLSFFRSGLVLLPGNTYHRKILMVDPALPMTPWSAREPEVDNIYSILNNIYHRHLAIFNKFTTALRNGYVPSEETAKVNRTLETYNACNTWNTNNVSAAETWHRLQVKGLLNQTPNEVHYYLHHLSCQGLQLLLFLEHQDCESLQNYLKIFFEYSQSRRQAAPGSEGPEAGVSTPPFPSGAWLYLDPLSRSENKRWKRATLFWDEARLEMLFRGNQAAVYTFQSLL